MRNNRLARSAVQCAIVVALGAALVACGGGGGDSPAPSVGANIDLTTANRDRVGHSIAAGVVALSPTLTIPLSANGAAADRKWAQAAGPVESSAWSGRLPVLLRQLLRVSSARAANQMARPLGVAGPVVYACAIAGTMSLTVDDRDDDGGLNGGDVVTTVYSNCQDTTFETLNGTVTTAITALGPTSMSARLTMSQFSDAAARHALTLDGSMWVDDSQPSGALEVTRLTADGPVVASVTTHLFTDTVTLQNGFSEEATYDAAAGLSTSTVNGSLRSAAAGGIVEISTPANSPLTKYDAEDYPRSGEVRVLGKRGTLWLTVLSTEWVQLDLDADDNGTAESSEVVSWDWLL